MTAGSILSATFDELLGDLANARNNDHETSPSLLATCALKYFQDVPDSFKNENDVPRLQFSLDLRYKKQRAELPPEIQSAMVLLDLLDVDNYFVNQISRSGPQCTSSPEAAASFVSQLPDKAIDEKQISRGVLFLVLTPDWQDYEPTVLFSAIRSHAKARSLTWQNVVEGLDQKGVEVNKEKFLVLFNAFLPIANDDPNFDIQGLWGGRWTYYESQLSFVRAFLSCSSTELDATTIPRLHQAYDPLDLLEGAPELRDEAEKASRDPMISLDAVSALIDLLIPANEVPSEVSTLILTEILADKASLFLCSLTGIPTPWTPGQENLMKSLFRSFLSGSIQESRYVLHTMWKQDKHWVAMCLMATHLDDPLDLVLILDVSSNMGWLEDLLTLVNGFGIDLAALALRKGNITLEQWLKDKSLQGQTGVIYAISKFLVLKAQDELRTSRDEQPQPRTVSLSMKTVYDLIALLEEHLDDLSELKALQRQCLQAYPRLIIFCEGITENVDVECTESNNLPRVADAEMQELYKRMYNGELSVQNVLEYLQDCKASDDPAKVDLFACMIHGLFDEFSCFSEYPLGPLATTAVLFGGIMQVRLISDLTLRVAQEMVLDSVRDFPPDEKMYKFGLQALIHVVDRFQEPEWIDYCAKLVKIPGMRGTDAFSAAAQALNQSRNTEEANGVNGLSDVLDLTNGSIDGMHSSDSRVPFKSVNVDLVLPPEEPDEATQEKVVFFFNNVTEQNLKTKIGQIETAISSQNQQWFAHSLVEGRAKVEPNNQPLYMAILELLSNKSLWSEVLRETLTSVQRLLNAESTLQSAADRKFLKNLSTWLGSLTLARNKPIKHKDIAFLDLLVEGFYMQKTILVIPFTCGVLAQGVRSRVFKPPNPWVVEVIAALMELYKEGNIKLNLKFEIEVLLKEFGLNVDSISPSVNFREKRFHDEEMATSLIPEGLDNFDDLSLGAISRGTRNSRFDVDPMSLNWPDLPSMLNFPPPSGSVANQTRLRQIVLEAVKRAIIEIVAPVVERSVTIATIATTSLIHKDFVTEGDEDRIRRAGQQMVRQLSGSLALVTCKEPLKMSMTNYIRMAQAELPDQAVPEGAILMCVNDNLDVACGIVEQQAEERSMPEIEAHIENELALRRRHLAEHPNEPYMSESWNRWANVIPEPYKQTPGGLNPEQMAIYLDFARQSRGPANHAQSSSADSGRQLPDILQDAFSSMHNVHGAGDNVALPQQTPQQPQHHLHGHMLPPPLPDSVRQPQTNGFIDVASYEERVQELMGEIRRVLQDGANGSPANQQQNTAIFDLLNQIWETIDAAPESVPMNCAENICKTLYGESMLNQEVEIFVGLLAKLYETYPAIRTEVTEWARGQDDERFLNVDVTFFLIKFNILQLRVVDAALMRLIYLRGDVIFQFISDLMDRLVLIKRPLALRSDFASTMGALSQHYTENSSSPVAKALLQRLRERGREEVPSELPIGDERLKEYSYRYIFSEWMHLYESYTPLPHEKQSSAFVSQMIAKGVLGSQEDTMTFLRLCIDGIADRNDINEMSNRENSSRLYFEVDGLARLIVVIVKNQAESNGEAKERKARYMDSLLSLVTLIMNAHTVTRIENFNQRMFFRLWSSILSDWYEYGREGFTHDAEMLLVFAENLLSMKPSYFPSFVFSWLALISHRYLMPGLLRQADEQVRSLTKFPDAILTFSQGYSAFTKLMVAALSYTGSILQPRSSSSLAADLYRSVLRIMLILHHDFPEFLVENHFNLCNSMPLHCIQFFNLVLSAYPSSFPELPNPFVTGLKVDRLEEMRKPPNMMNDYLTLLRDVNMVDIIDVACKSSTNTNEIVARINDAAHFEDPSGSSIDKDFIHALVIYIGQSAVTAAGQKTSQPFQPTSSAAQLLSMLAQELPLPSRQYLINAMANQLRYPNSHTHYFSSALLYLFGESKSHASGADQASFVDTASLIVRALFERLHVVRPHPWGLVSTMLELLKNPEYAFWAQSFVKDLPAVSLTFHLLSLVNREYN